MNDDPIPLKPLVVILINHIDYKGLNWPTATRVSELDSSRSLSPNNFRAVKAVHRCFPYPHPPALLALFQHRLEVLDSNVTEGGKELQT